MTEDETMITLSRPLEDSSSSLLRRWLRLRLENTETEKANSNEIISNAFHPYITESTSGRSTVKLQYSLP